MSFGIRTTVHHADSVGNCLVSDFPCSHVRDPLFFPVLVRAWKGQTTALAGAPLRTDGLLVNHVSALL